MNRHPSMISTNSSIGAASPRSVAPRRTSLLHRVLNRQLWNASWSHAAIIGLALCGSSCSSANKQVKNTFQPDPREAAIAAQEGKKATDPEVKHAYTAAKKGQQQVEPLAHASPESTSTAKAGEQPKAEQKPVDKRDALQLIASGEDPFKNAPIQQAADVQTAPVEEMTPLPRTAAVSGTPAAGTPATGASVSGASAAGKPVQYQNYPRESLPTDVTDALACPPSSASSICPPASPCGTRPFPGVEFMGDEFVCDGGDKGTPVHYEGMNRAGLDVEDTIAEYKDDTGKVHMKPSTQACIYAPRFASVSTSTLPEEGRKIEKAAGHQDQAVAIGMETKTVIDQKTQTDEAQGLAMRSRASGLRNRETEVHMHQNQGVRNHVKLDSANEDFSFLREGQFELANRAIVALGVNAAQEWADGRRPVIVAKDSGGQIVQGRFTAQDFTGVEDRRTPGELQLVKVADKGAAHPGDIVTFTIRFDNIGGRDLTSVRIVDNLSPRLEFIEDSISSNMNGKTDIDDNGLGGKLLTFEFEETLKGKTGGYVSFQCRVR